MAKAKRKVSINAEGVNKDDEFICASMNPPLFYLEGKFMYGARKGFFFAGPDETKLEMMKKFHKFIGDMITTFEKVIEAKKAEVPNDASPSV